MKLKLGKDNIFDCPEGTYRAVLERISEPKKRINKPCALQVRFTFRVHTDKGNEHLVARTFCADLSYGSELYYFLESWVDRDFAPFQDDNGEIDLDMLIGKEADLVIKHHDPGTHKKAFVVIAAIFPPGTLVSE